MRELRERLAALLKSGMRSSELWVSLIGLAVIALMPLIDAEVAAATGRLSGIGDHGRMAAAVVVAAYALARSIVKAAGASAFLGAAWGDPPPAGAPSEPSPD